MGLDIRWPIGLMFAVVGALLVLFGLITMGDEEIYKPSLGLNVNLWWGFALLIFGMWFVISAWRNDKKAKAQSKKSQT